MTDKWINVSISKITLALHVLPGTGASGHKNRTAHGFVLNDSTKQVYYHFSDGTVLKTRENDFFYLPKASSYDIKELTSGSCYAINFDADISDKPFSVNFRHNEKLIKLFKDSAKDWYTNVSFCQASIKRNIYEIIIMLIKEQQKNYLPNRKEQIILPALEKIKTDFNKTNISVSELSAMCNVSEEYFRKIFIEKFGISPKEYIIELRMNHAKNLLQSGMFSVSEVAHLCGYAENCHFSREFKKRIGENPSRYT